MSRIKPRVKRIQLDMMGEEWASCYIDFAALTWADVKQASTAEATNPEAAYEVAIGILKSKFIAGKGIGADGQPIDLKADDIDDLDVETQNALTAQLGGQPSPNS